MTDKKMARMSLYLAAIDGGVCKIGISKHPKRRIRAISSTQPHKARLVKEWKGAARFEPVVHLILDSLRQRGEWFKVGADFAEWVCEQVIGGNSDRAKQALPVYRQWAKCDEGGPLGELKYIDADLHELGFDTDSYRAGERMRKGLAEEKREWFR